MLEEIKRLLGLAEDDTGQDGVIKIIISLTSARLRNLLGGVGEIPEGLLYIVTEVSVARFNRVGSEGLASHSVEGESMSWGDDDFAPYTGDIESYTSGQEGMRKGKVRFL